MHYQKLFMSGISGHNKTAKSLQVWSILKTKQPVYSDTKTQRGFMFVKKL